jgi:hypothetical protein
MLKGAGQCGSRGCNFNASRKVAESHRRKADEMPSRRLRTENGRTSAKKELSRAHPPPGYDDSDEANGSISKATLSQVEVLSRGERGILFRQIVWRANNL